MTFRDDGRATLDWVAGYLERVRELPVMARVEPGEIRRALPASPPDEPEPFAAVLRDLEAVLLVGLEPTPVPVDDAFRLDFAKLDLTDAAAVVATVGTTGTTAVDPVPALADACRDAGAWLHVDAAYAGAAWVCPEFAWSRDGVECADSLVVNAHKWLLTPMDCSLLWSRRPADLQRAFS